MIQIFTSLLLGLLMILDPCTLFTSIAAIGYIDKEITNRQKVLLNGLMFVFGKLGLAIMLLMGNAIFFLLDRLLNINIFRRR